MSFYRDTFSGMKGANIYGELRGGFSYHASYGVLAGSTSSLVVNDIADNIRDVYNNMIPGVNLSYGIQDVCFTNTKNLGLRWSPLFTDGLQFSATYLGSEIDFDLVWDIPAGAIPSGVPLPPSTVHVDEASTTVLSVEYMIGSTVITGEYNMMKIDVRDVTKTNLLGWAVSLSHRINHWFEMGGYYSDLTTNVDDRNGDEYVALGRPAAERWRRDACTAIRFDLNEYWIVKLEAHLMDGLFQVDYGLRDNPSEQWALFAGKVSYTF